MSSFIIQHHYVYFVAHEYKHFSVCGTGLRSLMDTYVVLDHLSDDLDWDYIKNELKRLSIDKFENDNRLLALKVFKGEKLTSFDKELLNYYIYSGTYGNVENRLSNGLDKNYTFIGKIKYVLSRLKLPDETIREFYPFYYKHRSLRPYLYIKRLIEKANNNPRALKSEIRELMKCK